MEGHEKKTVRSDSMNITTKNEKLKDEISTVRAMACFDFDLTLSTFRVYGRRDFEHLPDLFGGPERIALLQDFFRFLTEHGVRIIIISWNYRDVIEEALQRVGLISHVHCVFDRTPMIRHGGYSNGKRKIIENLCKKWKIDNHNVVFVDDTEKILTGMSCQTILVEGAKGITLDEMKQVARCLTLEFQPQGNSNMSTS